MVDDRKPEITKRWLERLEKLNSHFASDRALSSIEFEARLKGHIQAEVHAISRSVTQVLASRQEVNRVEAVVNEKFSERSVVDAPSRAGLLSAYERMESRYKSVIDARRQEQWADTSALIKSLLFRILTAIGIAAVVLATAALAHHWGIPLPMVRPLT